jgi:hypothetical protein
MQQKILACLLCITPLGALADSLLPADALRQLIERKEMSAATHSTGTKASAEGPNQGHRQETLKPNETLEGFIKRTWPGLPSKEAWVRKAFVNLNGKAFVQGNPNLLNPGATMVVPNRDDLRASFAASHPQIAALFDSNGHDQQAKTSLESAQTPTQKWVRFP